MKEVSFLETSYTLSIHDDKFLMMGVKSSNNMQFARPHHEKQVST
jgi:hypothetical protein